MTVYVLGSPFELMLKVFEEKYPEIDCAIVWAENLKRETGAWGTTEFGKTILINIDIDLPIRNAPEVLGHELAHAAAGPNAGHSEEWKQIFEELRVLFNEAMKAEDDSFLQESKETT